MTVSRIKTFLQVDKLVNFDLSLNDVQLLLVTEDKLLHRILLLSQYIYLCFNNSNKIHTQWTKKRA